MTTVFKTVQTHFPASGCRARIHGEEIDALLIDPTFDGKQTDAGNEEGYTANLHVLNADLPTAVNDGDIVDIWNTVTEAWDTYRAGSVTEYGSAFKVVSLKSEFGE